MTRAFIIGSLVIIGFAAAQAQSLDDPRGGAIELNPGSEVAEPAQRISRSSQSGSQVTVGRKAAEKYMSQDPEESATLPQSPRRSIAMAADDHYLALHFGRFFSDNAYLWGPDKEDNIGNWNIGVTYRIGEWVNSMDLTLRIDLSQYSPDDAKATKLSFMPLITFPDASSRFPLYFGAGMGLGAFVNQIGKESSLSLDYQLVGGVRFFEILGTTGFFVEGGLKNHLFLLSDGQFNGAFMAVGDSVYFLMKIHKPIAQQVVTALSQIFFEGYHADKVIDRLFRNNKKLGSRDRKFIAESVYDINRWWRLLWSGLDGMPQNFSESDLWKLFGVWLVWKRQTQEREQELPNWPELKDLNPHEVLLKIKASSSNPAIRNSVADWLYDLGKMEFGEQKWIPILESLNKQAPVVLRANRLKVTRDELRRKFLEEGIETSPAPQTIDGLVLAERKNVFTSQSFQSGFFEVQDGASQQVAPLLDAQPGDRVIDACAGAGGKSLHLAAIMKNKGKIIAMDVHQRKLDELKKRSARAGCDIIETRLIDSSKTIKRLKDSADRLLLDVPCSGLGVLRRNPDSKWKLGLEEISRLNKIQAEILAEYSEMVKVGGRMVYATCSILPSENEKQVANFLTSHQGKWRLIEERQFHPGENGYDGFYAAALERIN